MLFKSDMTTYKLTQNKNYRVDSCSTSSTFHDMAPDVVNRFTQGWGLIINEYYHEAYYYNMHAFRQRGQRF